MGNCLPKSRKKNRVEPATDKGEEINEILSRSTEFQSPKANEPADMVKALKGTKDPTDEAAQTESKKAVAFTVDFEDSPVQPRMMPKRVAERLHAEREPKNEIEYTCEEEGLMADILREDRLKEVKEKARLEDIKIYDAHRRRLVAERSKEARAESTIRSSTPSLNEQKEKVKDLADEDRSRAAEKRREEKTE